MLLAYQLQADAHSLGHVYFNCVLDTVGCHAQNRQPTVERTEAVRIQLEKEDLHFLDMHSMLGIVHGLGPDDELPIVDFKSGGEEYKTLDPSRPVSILAGSNRQVACQKFVEDHPATHPLWKIVLYRDSKCI
jgi:hypothetical protein